jgi:hypothetical protein
VGLGAAIAINGAADEELAEAAEIEVAEQSGEPATYRIDYDLDIRQGDLPKLIDGRLDPGSVISIVVPTQSEDHCLVKGPVHSQKIRLKHGGAGSMLSVIGSDTSIAMDRETRTIQWTDVTDSDAVASILANYGYTADVETTDAGHFSNKHTLIQRDSDLRFIQRLARRNGFLFWLTCDAQGSETAHFKPPPLTGEPVLDLIINLDSPTIEGLDITWDVERPTSVVGLQLDLNTLADIDGGVPVSSQTVLGDQGLQAITGDTRSIHLLAPADDTGNLQARSNGLLTEANWFIRASCQTSLHALGRLVRAHTLVNLRGAGSRHSGLYFVSAVRHLIDAATHRMEVTLLRNGWLG